jgi:hypothetical protein
MSKVSIQGDASGTGTLTIAAPNTNSNYTLTLPTNTGTVMTSASDTFAGGLTLGGDLTLDSNGIYLGGTGAANYLDDYEEGTWTPSYETSSTNFSSITYDSIRDARYVKIGNSVFIEFELRTDAVTVGSASGQVWVTDLPFTTSTTYMINHPAALSYAASWNTAPIGGVIYLNRVYLYKSAAGGMSQIVPTDLSTGSNDNYLVMFGMYYVD